MTGNPHQFIGLLSGQATGKTFRATATTRICKLVEGPVGTMGERFRRHRNPRANLLAARPTSWRDRMVSVEWKGEIALVADQSRPDRVVMQAGRRPWPITWRPAALFPACAARQHGERSAVISITLPTVACLAMRFFSLGLSPRSIYNRPNRYYPNLLSQWNHNSWKNMTRRMTRITSQAPVDGQAPNRTSP